MNQMHTPLRHEDRLRLAPLAAGVLLCVGLPLCTACDALNSYPASSGPTTAPTVRIAEIGSELPFETTVRVIASGDYFFPGNARTLMTRCVGDATFTVTWSDGREPVEQECGGSDGAFTLDTPVPNATQVTFALGGGTFVDATVF